MTAVLGSEGRAGACLPRGVGAVSRGGDGGYRAAPTPPASSYFRNPDGVPVFPGVWGEHGNNGRRAQSSRRFGDPPMSSASDAAPGFECPFGKRAKPPFFWPARAEA